MQALEHGAACLHHAHGWLHIWRSLLRLVFGTTPSKHHNHNVQNHHTGTRALSTPQGAHTLTRADS